MSEPPATSHAALSSSEQDFEELEQTQRQQGTPAALHWLETKFRARHQYPQLFEILKIKCRTELGLAPIGDSSTECFDETKQRQLEDGILAACLEVGLKLWEQGDLERGWMYLQALGPRQEVTQALEQFPVTEDQLDALIDIAVSQSAAPLYGYRLLLQKYGTCNAITAFDIQAARFDSATQCQLAQALLHHLYQELHGNLLHAVRRSLDQEPNSDPTVMTLLETSPERLEQMSISEITRQCPAFSAGHGHLVDATHLASVVRIARCVTDRASLQQALELTEYGLELHPDFHYPGVPPFEDIYVDHQKFFQVQLGLEVETGLHHFGTKCDHVSSERFGGIAFETLADLLIRLGRRQEAIQLLAEHTWGKLPPAGIIGNVFLIPQTAEERAQLQTYFRSHQDLLSYGLSLMTT